MQVEDVSVTFSRMEQEILLSQTDDDFVFRYLQREDYGRGIMNVLGQLTVVGDVSQKDFEKQFDWMFPSHADTYFVVVIVDRNKDMVIGSATLIIEKKFLRSCGTVSTCACVNYYYSAGMWRTWRWTAPTGGKSWDCG